jgi:2-haloacid dehalogenase
VKRRDFLGAAVAGAVAPALPVRIPASEVASPWLHRASRGVTEEQQDVAANLHYLGFDTFGTVVDWRGSIIEEVRELSRQKGWVFDLVEFAVAWRANYGPSMNRVRTGERTGELPWTDLDGLHRMTLDDLFVRYNITGLPEAEKVHLNKVWHRLHPWPDAPSGLARLATRYVLSPMSNGNVALLTEMAKFGGLPWDCVMGSDIVRHYKPDREMYLAPSEFFKVRPERTMLVAAHPGDLDSAKSFGLRTAYVHRPLERGPDAEPWDPPEAGRFDFIAMDFHDLASQMGIWGFPNQSDIGIRGFGVRGR